MRRLCNKIVAELAWKIEHRIAVWKDAGLERLNERSRRNRSIPDRTAGKAVLAGYSSLSKQ